MNSEEGMSMAKMAVTVLLVILVIGAVATIVYAAYNWFTKGTDKLGDTVTSIDKSSYSQYDDAQVSGTDVLSALRSYRESDIAIFICNKKNGGYNATPSAGAQCYVYCAIPNSWTAGTAGTLSYTNDRFEFGGFAYVDPNNPITIQKNTNFSPTTTPGSADTYVKQSAKWYANLVYDNTTDEIAGIIFRQM